MCSAEFEIQLLLARFRVSGLKLNSVKKLRRAGEQIGWARGAEGGLRVADREVLATLHDSVFGPVEPILERVPEP